MSGPLDGIRVIELALEIQGPYAGLTLCELGAEVIKVESPGAGDTSRGVSLAKMVREAPADRADFRYYFYLFNRGKKSVVLDLKSEPGRDALLRLLEGADVLLSNFRVGVLDRLGLGWDELSKRFPRLIYAVATGWGLAGPRTLYPSRDMLAQAASGLMAKTGHDPDPPLPAGTNVADYSGAHMLVTAVLAALYQRERTGRGQRVDVSLYGTMLSLQPWELFQAELTGREPHRAGHAHPHMTGAWGGFRTADGWLVLSSIHDAVWTRFCEIIGRPDLAVDPQWTGRTRNVDGEAFRAIIADAFTGRTTAEWMAELGPAGVLVTPAASYGDVLADPQALASGYVHLVEHPLLGALRIAGHPIGFSDAQWRDAGEAPALGADTAAVLRDAGYDEHAIAKLQNVADERQT